MVSALLSKRTHSRLDLLILMCAAVVLLLTIKTPLNRYDEGFAVFGAARVLRGDLPYRDFWAIYPPGQFFVIAFLFDQFGENLIVSRVYDTVSRLGIVGAVYFLTRKMMPPALALLVVGVVAFLLASSGFYSYAVFPALALTLWSLVSFLHYLSLKRWKYLLLTGLIIGASSLFRWDIALYACITVLLTLIIHQTSELATNASKSDTQQLAVVILKPSGLLLGSALLIAAPVYGFLISKTGFDALWEQMVIFPTTQLHKYRWVPYPAAIPHRDEFGSFRPGEWLRFYLPPVVYGAAFIVSLYRIFRRQLVNELRHLYQIAVTVFGAFLFVQALSRYDYVHVIPTSLMVCVLVPSLLYNSPVFGKKRALQRVSVVLAIVVLAFYSYASISRVRTYLGHYLPTRCYSSLERAGCVYLLPDQQEAVQYVKKHTEQDEAIFVGNLRHDLIFVNDIGFYFLANRPSATAYHELYPGVATTLPVQETIVNDLEAKGVTWVVLVDMGQSNEPNASSVSSGVRYLDDHIRNNFVLVHRVGAYEIWKRRQ